MPIVGQAAPGEEVRLIGGVRLTGWQPVRAAAIRERLPAEAREKVVECELKNVGVTNFGTVEPVGVSHADLFLNCHYMTLARYPNAGWLRIAGVPADAQYKVKMSEPEAPATARRHHGPFQYEGDGPDRWKSATDVWVHGYWTYDWSDQYHRVERFDLEKKLIWPQPPYHHYGYTPGQRYYYLNLLEELDEPGEWYLDRASGVLYFWPPSPVDKAEVTFPDLEQPMFVLDNAQHVALRGWSSSARVPVRWSSKAAQASRSPAAQSAMWAARPLTCKAARTIPCAVATSTKWPPQASTCRAATAYPDTGGAQR